MGRQTLIIAALLLAACPRETIDLCAGADAPPECAGVDAGDQDAGDVSDSSAPDVSMVEPDAADAPDVSLPCGGPCAAPMAVCDAPTDTCVECLDSADCAAGVCDAATKTCVECLSNEECNGTTASLCDGTNTCLPCTVSVDCAHLTGTTVCEASECVECSGAEYAACGGVCDSRQRTCTNTPVGQSGLCESCVSDAQCRAGMLCVPMLFEAADGSGPAEVGTYCLWQRDSTVANAPNGACSTVRPYIDASQITSLDGVTDTVCGLRVTTCPGLNGFDATCAAAGVDDDCGAPGFDDGLCVVFDAAANLCTVPCLGDNDCLGGTCDTSVSPRRCEL